MQISSTIPSVFQNPAPSSSENATSSGAQNLDKDDFLRLLVAQLRSQDPLQPVTNEAFVAQLAQFSSLEQMQNINENLTDSLQAGYLLSATINNSLATTMIGSRVKVSTNEFVMSQAGSLDCSVELPTASRKLSVNIYNEKNELVKKVSIDGPALGTNQIHWDGKDESGMNVAPGSYRFEAVAEAFDGTSSRPNSFLTGTVTAVRYRDGGAVMLLDGVEVLPSDIIEVEKP